MAEQVPGLLFVVAPNVLPQEFDTKEVELRRALLVTQFCCVTNPLDGVRCHAQSRHAQQNCATRAYGPTGRTPETAHQFVGARVRRI